MTDDELSSSDEDEVNINQESDSDCPSPTCSSMTTGIGVTEYQVQNLLLLRILLRIFTSCYKIQIVCLFT